MRLAVLFSGGKDSTYAAYLMEQSGHAVEKLVTVRPNDPYAMLFHTLNLEMIPLQARAMGKELVIVSSSGEEKEDLIALAQALEDLEVDGIVTGAIASDYQWDRINGIGEELGLRVFSPLWRKDQELLLRDMVGSGVRAIIVGTFAEGLDEKWLGREIDEGTIDELVRMKHMFGINISGEGGEYETLVLDSPLHASSIKVVRSHIERDRSSSKLIVEKAALNER